MIFLSRDKGLRMIISPVQKYIHRTSSGNISEIIPGKRIQFQKLAQPIPCSAFPTKGESGHRWGAEGVLDSKLAAKQAQMKEDDVINWLLHNDDYGIKYVAVDDDSGVPLVPEEVVLEVAGDGWHCTVCDQYIEDGRGKKPHLESKKHLEKVRLLEAGAFSSLQNTI
ncbi:MAG: hypothetical protein ACYSUD_13160 [Planctomycetota bacterium]|jgi:hypothetical protein